MTFLIGFLLKSGSLSKCLTMRSEIDVQCRTRRQESKSEIPITALLQPNCNVIQQCIQAETHAKLSCSAFAHKRVAFNTRVGRDAGAGGSVIPNVCSEVYGDCTKHQWILQRVEPRFVMLRHVRGIAEVESASQ